VQRERATLRFGARCQHRELVASDAHHLVLGSLRAQQQVGEPAQRVVAHLSPAQSVRVTERVDIAEQERKRTFGSEAPLDRRLKGARVWAVR